MSDKSFPVGGLAAFGAQMTQAWEKVLESFWQSLLNDPQRLAELAGRLAAAVPGVGAVVRGPVAADVAALTREVEDLRQRLGGVERQLQDLTGSLASMVSYLEALHSGTVAEDKQGKPS